ncbi:hypothetical protein NDU88_000672 [Pleurodeles waltl]|uniref:Uncharacterized protein n=1 Tax=Pleurodeles waltl TaxID=8319 RepID=A0AAV7R7F8_PLEWA|nr:hypothetical protein NDU88_000672 [Pleurodeles waltl]
MGLQCSSNKVVEDEFFSWGCDRLWGNKLDLDEKFLMFLDVDSTSALIAYNQEIVSPGPNVPDFSRQLITLMGGLTTVPHAFGIGALFLSMFLDLALNSVKRGPNFESVLQKVFAQEKVSEIRDLMEVYRRRWKVNVRDTKRLVTETADYERKLHEQLVRVRNSMLQDGQLNTRALKIWMHGAMLHVTMNIYLAALQGHTGPEATGPISSLIDEYIRDGEVLLDKYQPFQRHQIDLHIRGECVPTTSGPACSHFIDFIRSSEHKQDIKGAKSSDIYLSCRSEIEDTFVQKMRANCPAPRTFINYLNKVQSHLNTLVHDKGAFQIK